MTQVTNQTLGKLLRVLIKPKSKAWDLLLPHAELAYNKAPNRTTRISPFKVLNGIDPIGPLDLVPRPLDQGPSAEANQRVEEIKRCVNGSATEKINATYSAQANKRRRRKVFQPDDLVWVHLRKD